MQWFKQLDAWLEWAWNHSPAGKAEQRQRERQMQEWRWRDMQRVAQQTRTRIEQSHEYLNAAQVAALATRLAQVDDDRAALEEVWPDGPYMPQDIEILKQRYSWLGRHAQAAVAGELGEQDVAMRIGQVQQAIAKLPASDDTQQRRGMRSPEKAQEHLTRIEAHLQRLQKRRQKLLSQPFASEADYLQRLEKLAADLEALERRGLKLWRTLAPKEFEQSIAAVRQFQADAGEQ